MRFDPLALDLELLAAGVPRAAFVGCRSDTRRDQDGTDDVAQIIDWAPGHPTPAERTIARATLAAHDPQARRTAQAQRRRQVAEIEARMKAGTESAAEVREHRRLQIELREGGPER
jgi:hypothetical protein